MGSETVAKLTLNLSVADGKMFWLKFAICSIPKTKKIRSKYEKTGKTSQSTNLPIIKTRQLIVKF